MSTRSKTRLASASTSKVLSSGSVPKDHRPMPQSRKSQSVRLEADQLEKENIQAKTLKGSVKNPPTKNKALKSATPTLYCTCERGDDGTPMVQCGECNVWYHFNCVELSEEHADDINIYVCPSCTETSGRRTAMFWEGPDAVEECSDPELIHKKKKPSGGLRRRQQSPADLPSESEEDPSSEDEYIANQSKPKGKGIGKRHTRRLSFSSESDSEISDDARRSRRARARKVSVSPTPSHGHLKRKTEMESHSPPPKRKKSYSNVTEDPTRKYCLGKLEEVFRDIFFRYPHVRVHNPDVEAIDKAHEEGIVEKPLDELTEEEKAKLLDESKEFATELERCVYDIYSEPDKQGHPSAGGKYKDRFRMLQFNLSKVDRVVIHQRIASALITPKEISLMSSTDLANEETKQSIKIAEKEALAYSILQPTTVPRAKITHKGLEDIEDVHGERTSVHEQERERIQEEERRDRERMARLRAQKRQRTSSVSVPPESPVIHQHSPAWGAPPPVPMHAMPPDDEIAASTPAFGHDGQSVNALVVHPASDLSIAEPELNLSEFINIDEEPSSADVAASTPMTSPPLDHPVDNESSAPQAPSIQPPHATPASPTGISPFAAKPERSRAASFDLNTLWNAPKTEASVVPASPLPPPAPLPPSTSAFSAPVEEPKDIIMEPATGGADDQDFDMFLDEKDQDSSATSPEALQAAFDALPQVWTGRINMPLDLTMPQETPVIARQMGGRSLAHDSVLWKTLFPSDLLRIDGRVPVENSGKFLLQMRMNVAKELIGVAFSPAFESSDVGFRILSDFLIAKGRHGLVFPWGKQPKDDHPGRELYIIPLLSSDPLPDYMELLDDLHLPKIRKVNYLIGIWVLNRGKLAPPPAPPPHVVTQIPSGIQLPILNTSAPIPLTSSLSNPPPPPLLPAAIAAEVASLTPEQIQLMIRTLASSAPISLPVPAPHQSHPPPTQPPLPIPPTVPPQSWPNPAHNFAGRYPPPNSPPHRSPPRPQPSYDRHDYGHDSRPGPGYNRGDRGDRGWGGRGRGRGRGNDNPHKPLDSGWPRRPRNDSRGAGPSSPTRRW